MGLAGAHVRTVMLFGSREALRRSSQEVLAAPRAAARVGQGVRTSTQDVNPQHHPTSSDTQTVLLQRPGVLVC